MTFSIRQFLLIGITLSLVITFSLLIVISYFKTKDELDELYDANLQQVAILVGTQYDNTQGTLALDPHLIRSTSNKIKAEHHFYVRISDAADHALYISHPNIQLPTPTKPGISTIIDGDQRWRVFSLRLNNERIDVAQALRARDSTIIEVALSLVLPYLLLIPGLLLLVWVTIQKGLKPLDKLSYTIQSRQYGLLEPLSIGKIPVEIKPLVDALNGFIEKLANMVEVQKRFTSDAAHELRTPLAAVSLQIELLEHADDALERKMAIESLKSGINRSIGLVNQLMTMAMVEPGALQLPLHHVSLATVIKSSVEQLLPFASIRNIDLGANIPADIVINGEFNSLVVLLNNLIDNAIKYTPKNGVVDVNLLQEGNVAILQVRDTGPGIPAEVMPHVLERFYRGEHPNIHGSGLGLSIVQSIVEQHDAIVQIENAPERGLLVSIRFKNIQVMKGGE